MKGLFVTGTGTNVGKTVAAAALLCRLRRDAPVRYWKPVQTGVPDDDDTAVVRELATCSDEEILADGIRLPRPVSPHLAAELSGAQIDIASIVRMADEARNERTWLIEGAGGVLVPLNQKEMMIDLMAALKLPAVVVAFSQLGTINHTLLTLEALRKRAITVAGVILNGEPNAANRYAIESFGNVAVLGEMPRFDPLTPDALEHWAVNELDGTGILNR